MRREKEWIKPNKYYNITRRIISSISPPLARTSCLSVMPIQALPIYSERRYTRRFTTCNLPRPSPVAYLVLLILLQHARLSWLLPAYCNNILDASRHFFLPRFETIWNIETFLDKKPCTGWVAISIFCKLRETVFNFKQKAFHLMQNSGLPF